MTLSFREIGALPRAVSGRQPRTGVAIRGYYYIVDGLLSNGSIPDST